MEKKENEKDRESFNHPVSIKLTRSEKYIWDNNKWIAAEIRDMVRKYIDIYVIKK